MSNIFFNENKFKSKGKKWNGQTYFKRFLHEIEKIQTIWINFELLSCVTRTKFTWEDLVNFQTK